MSSCDSQKPNMALVSVGFSDYSQLGEFKEEDKPQEVHATPLCAPHYLQAEMPPSVSMGGLGSHSNATERARFLRWERA